jgi:hypothetical protein
MNYCRCPQPVPANGDLRIRPCTRCGFEIRGTLEQRISGLEKDLEVERKERLNLQQLFNTLDANMETAIRTIEHLTKLSKDQQDSLTIQDKELSNIYEVLKKTVMANHRFNGLCSCQQLTSTEVWQIGSNVVHHICVTCFKEIDPQRIKNEKAVDEACRRTENKENVATAADTAMSDIIKPQDTAAADEADEIHRAGSKQGLLRYS